MHSGRLNYTKWSVIVYAVVRSILRMHGRLRCRRLIGGITWRGARHVSWIDASYFGLKYFGLIGGWGYA